MASARDRGQAERALLRRLADVLPPERLLTDPLERRLYGRDASYVQGDPLAVALVAGVGELRHVVAACHQHGIGFTARGAGTALTGAASPLERSLVVSTTPMNRVLDIDPVHRVAWVEPGVINADLSKLAAPHGLHYAPDPSSAASCTIGGNIATNAGGAHTLLHGVTVSHVLAVDLVLPDGRLTRIGSLAGESFGPDLRALVVGSEGTLGVVAAAAVRLTPIAPALETFLLSFDSVAAAGETVSAVIASGVSAGAIELMDQAITRAVERFLRLGLPVDAAAVVLIELEGERETVGWASDALLDVVRGSRHVHAAPQRAQSPSERASWWLARKSAVGAMAQIEPNYYLHDTVIPRTQLAPVLEEIAAISTRWQLPIVNVFHAGDGNLHPVVAYDRRRPGVFDRVLGAGSDIIKASLAAGGVLTGEHGIGVEKLEYMRLQFDEPSLDLQRRLRAAFDPVGLANPAKLLPAPTCGSDVVGAR